MIQTIGYIAFNGGLIILISAAILFVYWVIEIAVARRAMPQLLIGAFIVGLILVGIGMEAVQWPT